MSIRLLACFLAPLPLAAQDLPIRLDQVEASALRLKHARFAADRERGAVTFTFGYTQGEAEAWIPARVLGIPSDWRPWKGLNFDFHATSLEAFSLLFSDGKQVKGLVMEPLAGLRLRAAIPFDAFVQTRTMTPLLPLGYKAWPNRLFTFERVEEIGLRMRYPSQDSQLTLWNLKLTAGEPRDDILDRRPVVDRFGQWIPENWPGKAHSEDELAALWKADVPEPALPGFCPLGGMKERTLPATGFFRTERVDGRWVFVDPHGHPFYSAGMDLVGFKQGSFATRVTGREYLFEELPPPGPAWLAPGRDASFQVANIMRRYGPDWQRKWTEAMLARLKSWGFNTVANWSDRELAVSSGMPYVLPLSGWTTKKTFPFPWDFPDVFSEEFERNADAAAQRQCAPLKSDANLIGWFIGNEPHWAREFSSLKPWADMLLEDPEPSDTKDELKKRLAARPAEAQAIKDGWVYECGRRYFETIARAVRKHDPNHLVLGIRYAGRAREEWIRLSSLFDAFSVNIYSADFAPDPKVIAHYASVSGKPVVIGEFTACAAGRGLQGLFYWVHKVRDHAERGTAYRYYVENAAADPNIIGTHWFQLVDDLPTGRPSDEERLNYGFLNVLDLPYPDLVNAARATHPRLYDLKFGKTKPFSLKPRFN